MILLVVDRQSAEQIVSQFSTAEPDFKATDMLTDSDLMIAILRRERQLLYKV